MCCCGAEPTQSLAFSNSASSASTVLPSFVYVASPRLSGFPLRNTTLWLCSDHTLPPRTASVDRTAPPSSTGYALVITVAVYICAASMAETFTNVQGRPLAYALIALLSTLFILPLGSGPWVTRDGGYTLVTAAQAADSTDSVTDEKHLINSSDTVPSGNAAVGNADIGLRSLPWDTKSYSFLRALISCDFILIFLIFFFSIGAGIAVVNNLPEIVLARLPQHYEGKVIASSDLPHSKDRAALLVLVRRWLSALPWRFWLQGTEWTSGDREKLPQVCGRCVDSGMVSPRQQSSSRIAERKMWCI